MRFEGFSFGRIQIDGVTYEHDVVIERGEVRKRNKKPSKELQGAYGHTPLSSKEEIPWKCRRLVVGTGMHAAPLPPALKRATQKSAAKNPKPAFAPRKTAGPAAL
jgi:hypothetical protein